MDDFFNNFVNIIYVIIDAIRSLVESLRGPRFFEVEETAADETTGD